MNQRTRVDLESPSNTVHPSPIHKRLLQPQPHPCHKGLPSGHCGHISLKNKHADVHTGDKIRPRKTCKLSCQGTKEKMANSGPKQKTQSHSHTVKSAATSTLQETRASYTDTCMFHLKTSSRDLDLPVFYPVTSQDFGKKTKENKYKIYEISTDLGTTVKFN